MKPKNTIIGEIRKVDTEGRIVIPKYIREKFNWLKDDFIQFLVIEDSIILIKIDLETGPGIRPQRSRSDFRPGLPTPPEPPNGGIKEESAAPVDRFNTMKLVTNKKGI